MDIFSFVHQLLDLFREGFKKEFELFVIAELATDIIFPIGQIHRRQVFVCSGTIKFYIGSKPNPGARVNLPCSRTSSKAAWTCSKRASMAV